MQLGWHPNQPRAGYEGVWSLSPDQSRIRRLRVGGKLLSLLGFHDCTANSAAIFLLPVRVLFACWVEDSHAVTVHLVLVFVLAFAIVLHFISFFL